MAEKALPTSQWTDGGAKRSAPAVTSIRAARSDSRTRTAMMADVSTTSSIAVQLYSSVALEGSLPTRMVSEAVHGRETSEQHRQGRQAEEGRAERLDDIAD